MSTTEMYPVPFADHPDLFRYLPGVKALLPKIPPWEERIKLVTPHGLTSYPIMVDEVQIERDEAEEGDEEEGDEGEVAPQDHRDDLSAAGVLQCCLLECHPRLRQGKRSRALELLAHALLTYNHGCFLLEHTGPIQGEILACLDTVQWLAEVAPLLKEPLGKLIQKQPTLEGLTAHQIEKWLLQGRRILQALATLPNDAYANMAYPFHAWARSTLDYQVPSLWSEIIGRTYPDGRPIEASPLAKLKNLIYTRRWPKAIDQRLLIDVLVARMYGALRRYGPKVWRDSSIYPVIVAILQECGVSGVALTPANLRKRMQRLHKTVAEASTS